MHYELSIDRELDTKAEKTYDVFGISEARSDYLRDRFRTASSIAGEGDDDSITLFLNELPRLSPGDMLYLAYVGFIARRAAEQYAHEFAEKALLKAIGEKLKELGD